MTEWNPLLMQRDFCRAMDIPVATKPVTLIYEPAEELLALGSRLITEEFNELSEEINHLERIINSGMVEHEAEALAQVRMRQMTAEMADLIYVICQTANMLGLPLQEFYTAIHQANMKKADPETGKVIYREDGKVLKPEGWQPADLKKLWYKALYGG